MSANRKPRRSRKKIARRQPAGTVLGGPDLVAFRPRPPYLYEEYASGIPVKTQDGWLNKRQRRYILWARAEGSSARTIALDLHCGEASVKRLISKALYDSAVFVYCGFVMTIRLGNHKRDRVTFCRMCGDIYRDIASAADHAFLHLWGEEILDDPERGWRA